MSESFAAPSCSIEVYPFEGGPYTIQGGQIRSVTFDKNIRGGSVGNLIVELAPGGPFGPESPQSWTEVITPMSHILVGMSRGDRAAIIMDGVVLKTAEGEVWHTEEENSFAYRTQIITAADYAWFFQTFNWYSLSFFGLTAGTSIGQAMGFAPAGIPYLLDQGLLGSADPKESNPAAVARRWYEKVMAGQGAILGKTYVPYKSDSRILFSGSVTTLWENYLTAYIPFPDYFMSAEGSWMAKFQGMLPFPWYEFFITTAPSGTYILASGATGTAVSGKLYTMQSQPLALPAGPQLVARVNPVPSFNATADAATTSSTFDQLDMTRWTQLPLDSPTGPNTGFYSSEIEFNAAAARNFYQLNPTAYATLFGVNNANNIPFPFSFMGAADTASIHRYGFRPEIGTTRWMFDPQGNAAQNKELNIPQTIATLTARLVSWHHPMPLMANAMVVFPLMPDIMIGTRFRYAPFKNSGLWEFYVEGVNHKFTYGRECTTTLTLSRGLPVGIYQDASPDGLLRQIYFGNAMRKKGRYVVGLPEDSSPALTTFGTPESIKTFMGNAATIFVTPQKGNG